MAKREHLELNPLKNFQSADQLIDGYQLFVKLRRGEKRSDRKVTLIGRPLPNGNVSLYRYAFVDGKKKLESTGAILKRELRTEDKNDNKIILSEQRIICDTLQVNLTNGKTTFNPTPRKSKKLLFADYVKDINDFKPSLHSLLSALSLHLRTYNASLRLTDVDTEVVKDFIGYLKNKAVSQRYKKNEATRLSVNTQYNLCVALSMVLKKAVTENLLPSNPMDKLSKWERPSKDNDRRTYLTPQEVARLMKTPYPCTHKKKDYETDVPRAFLFSCFAGLRVSDIVRLTGENVGTNEYGTYISFKVKKTNKMQTQYLNDIALQYLPHHQDKKQPLFNLPDSKNLNIDIKKWCKKAGIEKEVSFHTARHTCATFELGAGVPIEIISDQLGHSKISTTQIYAKVMRETQRKATNKMADFFKRETTDKKTAVQEVSKI